MNMKSYIGRRIRALREDIGWSQEQLGEKFEKPIKKQTISSWENGRTTPDADLLVELCEIFNVDISLFYEKSTIEYAVVRLSPAERNLLESYRNLSEKSKHLVDELIGELDEGIR